MKLVSVFGVLVLCFISLSCCCLLAQDVSADGEGPTLVVDRAQVFTEEQLETLQAKALELLLTYEQPVVIYTAKKSKYEDVSDVKSDAWKYVNENWPQPERRTLEEITSGKPREKVDPIRKKMTSPKLLIFAYEPAQKAVAVGAGYKAGPDDHERKHLIKSYVEAKMETAGFYEASALGLEALKALHAGATMPSRPSTLKSRALLIGGVLLTLLVLSAAIFGTGESGPMYYLGYFFTILGGIFGSAMFLSGANDRRHGHRNEEALSNLKGTFKG